MEFAADRPLYNFEKVSASSVSDRVFRTIRHISDSGENNSFTIALTGKWGSGKTSALNHILSLIDADNVSSVTSRNDQNNRKSDSKPKTWLCSLGGGVEKKTIRNRYVILKMLWIIKRDTL